MKKNNRQWDVGGRLRYIALQIVILLYAVILFSSCDDADFKYSNFHCNFMLNNFQHQDATLATAMNSFSKGVFCRITYQMKSGAKYYVFENTLGDRTEKIFNAEDEQNHNEQRQKCHE